MGTVIEDNYIENPEFALKCIIKVIKAAIKKRPLYNNRLAYLLSTKKKKQKAFFLNDGTENTEKYPHIIYEIYNEPMEDSWESVKEICS